MPSPNDQHTPHCSTHTPVRPVRRPARAERGTVLLMVVGVLALLAIIAVVYATLGRSDRATTAALVRQQRLDDQAEDIASYLAQVISDGAWATYASRDQDGDSYLRTSGADIPWTNEHFISLNPRRADGTSDLLGTLSNAGVTGLPANDLFGGVRANEPYAPTGSSSVGFTNADSAVIDTREHGASFLASLGPVWLDNLQGHFDNAPGEPLRRRRDWAHISNFAPSGNFINLAYLRNNFRAESGFGMSADGNPRLSSGLTLFEVDSGNVTISEVPRTALGMDRPPHAIIPADWTNNQVWAFRPMIDTTYAPQDPEYLLNQWGDTDGDGFADARWFELTDISRAWTGDNMPTAIIPTNGSMRLVVAARCIDASALVNVTTATDFARHPGQVRSFVPNLDGTLGAEQFNRDAVYLPGASPADIDLRRLLTMVDFSYEYGMPYGGGMSGFTRPRYNGSNANDPNDYTNISHLPAAQIGSAAYLSLQRYLSRTAVMINPEYGIWNRDITFAFDANALGSNRGQVQTQDEILPATGLLVPSRLDTEWADTTITPFAPDHRFLSFARYGYRPMGVTTEGNTRLFFGGFGANDALELFTFRGLNNPDNTSRLETAMAGRSPLNNNMRSPLRDERPLSIERAGRTMRGDQLFATSNQNDGAATAQQVIATLHGDVRASLTPISGARPLIDVRLASSVPGVAVEHTSQDLTPDLATLRLGEFTDTSRKARKDASIQKIVDFYARALLPFRNVTGGGDFSSLWDPSDPLSRGLSYGGSAELAFRCAIHLAANLIDALDEDGTTLSTTGLLRDKMQPTAISVEVKPGARGLLSGGGSGIENNFPWLSTTAAGAESVFRPEEELRPATSDLVRASHVVNVFGVEPQPFLIEYGAFFMYTDAPDSVTGASDDPDPIAAPPTPPGGDAVFQPLKVSLNPTMSNGDFLGEVFFIQVTNPFDDEVTLYDAGQSDLKDRPVYYAKFANRAFIFGEQSRENYDIVPTTIRLAPGETRVFYALNPGTQKQLEERIRRAHNARPSVAPDDPGIMPDGFMTRWFELQFKPGAIQIPMVYPETFRPVGDVISGGSPSPTGDEIDLFGDSAIIPPDPNATFGAPDVATKGQRKSAQLWRVMRGRNSTDTARFGTAGDQTASGDNDPANDLLADRLRDPGTSSSDGTLWSLRPSGSGTDADISGTEAGDENGTTVSSNPKQVTDVQDNTGFTFTLWASIRRPTDEIIDPDSAGYIVAAASGNRPVLGVLPPWCLEAKADHAYDVGRPDGTLSRSLNLEFDTPIEDQGAEGNYPNYVDATSLAISAGTESDRFRTIAQFVNSNNAINDELKKSAYEKTGNQIPRSLSLRSGTSDRKRYIEVAPEFHFVGQDDHGGPLEILHDKDTNTTLTRTSRNGALFSRIGDMLLPLAVGPWSDPIGAQTSTPSSGWSILPLDTDPNNWVGGDLDSVPEEYGWTTLGESLALATGYYSPPDVAIGTLSAPNMFVDFGIDEGTSKVSKSDRGFLRLDAFIPHRVISGADIEPIGLGVPFALNVLTTGRVEYGIGSSLRGDKITGLVRKAAPGGLTKAIPGPINLNTTSVEIARTVPMLSPPPQLTEFDPNFTMSWMTKTLDIEVLGTTIKTQSPALFISSPSSTDPFDLATSLIAYRDKMTLRTRPKDLSGTPGIDVSFLDTGSPRTGRSLATGMIGAAADPARLRESRGFRSLGEVLAVNLRENATSPTDPTDRRNQSMTRLGVADPAVSTSDKLEQPGIVASRYYNRNVSGQVQGFDTANLPIGLETSDVPEGYAAKIAIANALVNTASVRSDVFICWFIVHGYLPEDVQVEDDEPMVPTVAKRFVMVVDRSTSTGVGQKPRILLFKEVPMAN